MQVTVHFHASAQLPAAGSGLNGARRPFVDGIAFTLDPAWSVRDFSDVIERYAAETSGIGVRVVALTNPARGKAMPPHEQAISCFSEGDKAVVVGDAQPRPYPAPTDEVDLGRGRPQGEPVPVTIFTGFLGSGKTTVLNHLLMGQRDKKFAVIENEFGEVPIDNELLQNSAMSKAEQVVVMENGCMCCTVRGDLLGAFDSIRRQIETTGQPLDAVLVETTGMADPVPIVRTLRQTPDIARYFRLDGTITLVDTKTIRDRLAEFEGGNDDQERHQQISFADRLLLNKLDLVSDDDVVEVYQRIRSFNASAKIIGSVKGIVPASDLTGLGAFDVETIAAEQSEFDGHGGHGEHGHGHGHGHDECDEGHGHGDGHGHGHDEHGMEGHGDPGSPSSPGSFGHSASFGHSHLNSNHDKAIGSFSLVHKGMEVEPLAFARWVRIIATLPPEQGVLYRSKGVLAAAGRSQKLIFHAVADVTETQDGPEWGENEPRVCKMVFIGKKLDRAKIEERFVKLLQPVRARMRLPIALLPPAPRLGLLSTAQGGMLHRALLGCWTKDVLRLSQCSAGLHDAVFAPEARMAFQAAAADLPQGAPRGLHRVDGQMWLHGILPVYSVTRYVQAWRQANVSLKMPAGPGYIHGVPLDFDDFPDVEAAGVMWLELCEIQDSDTVNFVVEFRWRPQTMQSFFAVPGSSTNSALVKIEVEDPSGDTELDDELRFRVNLNPEESAESGMAMHRLSLQLVGGKAASHVYAIFFHTVDPAYQVHINVPDNRMPIFPTKEVFHQWHPLMSGLRRRPRLRFLIRMKPMDSGPLDAMCGCCG